MAKQIEPMWRQRIEYGVAVSLHARGGGPARGENILFKYATLVRSGSGKLQVEYGRRGGLLVVGAKGPLFHWVIGGNH